MRHKKSTPIKNLSKTSSLRVLRASAVRFLLLFNPPPKDPNLAAENKPSTPQLTAYQQKQFLRQLPQPSVLNW
jgi:hypothetical protein